MQWKGIKCKTSTHGRSDVNSPNKKILFGGWEWCRWSVFDVWILDLFEKRHNIRVICQTCDTI